MEKRKFINTKNIEGYMKQITAKKAEQLSNLFGIAADPKKILLLEAIYVGKSIYAFSQKSNIPRSTVQSHLKTALNCGLVAKGDEGFYLTPVGQSFLSFLRRAYECFADLYKDYLSIKSELNSLSTVSVDILPHLSIEVNGNTKKVIERINLLKRKESELELELIRRLEDYAK